MSRKDVVIHITKMTRASTLASIGIARFLYKTLKLDVIDSKEDLLKAGKLNRIFLVNGPPAFCNFREELAEAVRHCNDLIWINNDFTIYPPSQVNKVMRERGWVNEKGHVKPPRTWTTIPDKVVNTTDAYVNWNALTFRNVMYPGNGRNHKLFYYGAFRKGRIDSFRQYLDIGDDLIVSASAVAGKNFAIAFPEAEIQMPHEDIISELANYKFGLYIHDHQSSKKFMSLANRFYEMLTAGVLIFVAEDAVKTFEVAGYELDSRFIVDDAYAVKTKMHALKNTRKYNALLSTQQKMWRDKALRERRALTRRVRKLEGELK